MPFSAETRAELVRIWPEKRCCRRAELAGIALALGEWEPAPAGGGGRLWVAANSAALIRKAYRLLRDLGYSVAHETIGEHRHAAIATLRSGRRAAAFLAAGEGPKRACCARAFLRGFFEASGSVAEPHRTYHLEFVVHAEAPAATLLLALRRLGLNGSVAPRKRGFMVYIKDADAIVAALRELGAHQALMRFENVRIMKDMRNQVNRLVNAETANVDKTVQAALQQSAAVRRIAERIGLEALPPALGRAAQLRLAHPYASLRELAELAPDVTKSGISYRLRRLCEIAERLEQDNA